MANLVVTRCLESDTEHLENTWKLSLQFLVLFTGLTSSSYLQN
jgi:hypothetical protein